MLSSVKQHPAMINLQKQYEMLSGRDRVALNTLAVVLFFVLSYYLLWQPAHQYMRDAESDIARSEQLLVLVRQNRSVLASMAKSGAQQGKRSSLDSQQLVSSVTNLAKRHGVTLKRFEPGGEREIKVWIDDASFDKIMLWLKALGSSLQVTVEQISVEKGEAPGRVSARLTLAS